MIKEIPYFIYGLLSGSSIAFKYASSKNIQQGQTDSIAYRQAERIRTLLHFGSYVYHRANELEYTSSPLRGWKMRLLSYPIPFALQILNHRIDGRTYPNLKKGVLFARNHMEHVALVVDILLSGYFALCLSKAYRIGLLIGLTIEILKGGQFFNPRIKDLWERARLALLSIHAMNAPWMFASFSYYNISHSVLEFAIYSWEHYIEKPLVRESKPRQMTIEEAKEILVTPIEQFQVDPAHLLINAKQSGEEVKDVDIIGTMEKLVEQFEWKEEDYNTFKIKMLNDVSFQSSHLNISAIEEISNEEAKMAFETGARQIAFEIANECIESGDSYIRYDLLQSNLKAVLKMISTCEDEEIKDDLFKLAIEGGAYCASGKVNIIQEVFETRVQRDSTATKKFLLWLQMTRENWFKGIYADLSKYAFQLPKGIIDPSDLHFYLMALFYFDRPFKLHEEVIKNDMSLHETGICSYTYRMALSKLMEYIFWPYALNSPNWYSPHSLLKAIVEHSKTFSKSGRMEQQWWQEWLNEVPDSPEKEELLEQFLLLNVFGQPLHVESSEGLILNPPLVKIMLYRMGIIKLPK